MSDRPTPETDAAEAKRRAEWLRKHKAHKDWIILSVSEVTVICDELLILERERDEAREERDKIQTELGMWRDGNILHEFHQNELEKVEQERDEAREELLEQARLLGMSSEREAKLISELDEARKKYDNLATEHMLVVNKLCNERDEALKESEYYRERYEELKDETK